MIILKTVAAFKTCISKKSGFAQSSGFVPTMGALHDGHISLITQSRKQNQYSVASIFVNPTQFNVAADFQKYPVTIAEDIKKLENAGCDLLFLPSIEEVYPNGTNNGGNYELGGLENVLEGFYRPGHFQGVCQVVDRLLEIVNPTRLYLGQKDFQQCMVVQKMIALKEIPVELHTVPTMREERGLAMSSRNMRLSEEQKKIALNIFGQLQMIKENAGKILPATLKETAMNNLLNAGFTKVDYVEIARPASLEPILAWEPRQQVVALVAAWLGDVRLIDNMIIE